MKLCFLYASIMLAAIPAITEAGPFGLFRSRGGNCANGSCAQPSQATSAPQATTYPPATASRAWPVGVAVYDDGSIHWVDAKMGRVTYSAADIGTYGYDAILDIVTNGHHGQTATVQRYATPISFGSCAGGNCPR